MNLFKNKGELQKDYGALLGTPSSSIEKDQDENSVLELTAEMFYGEEPLLLSQSQIIHDSEALSTPFHAGNELEKREQLLDLREQQLELLRTQLEQEREALTSQNNIISEADTEIEAAFTKLEAQSTRLDEREVEIQTLRAQLEKDAQRLSQREQQLDDLFVELGEQSEALGQQRRSIKNKQNAINKRESELSQAEANVNALKQSLLKQGLHQEQTIQTQEDELYKSQKESKSLARQLASVKRLSVNQSTDLKQFHEALQNKQQRLDEAWQLLQEAELHRFDQADDIRRKSSVVKTLSVDLDLSQEALGEAQAKISLLEDKLFLTGIRLSQREKRAESQKALKENLSELETELSHSRNRLKDAFDENLRLSTALQESEVVIARLETRQVKMTETMKQARQKLISMQRLEDRTQSENALLVAQNRALQNRQTELNDELEFASSIMPDYEQLKVALREAKMRETELLKRLESSEAERSMMEKMATILRDKARPSVENLSIPGFRAALNS